MNPRCSYRFPERRSADCASQRRGGIILLMIVLIPVLLVIAGFCINLCYIELVQTELQIASDAASRGAGRALARTGDSNIATQVAQEIGLRNRVAGSPVQINTGDLVYGQSSRNSVAASYDFQPNKTPYNAVELLSNPSFATGHLNLPVRFGFESVQFAPTRISRATQVELDVAIVLDRSGSMAFPVDQIAAPGVMPSSAPPGWNFGDPAPPGSRWTDAVVAVTDFLNEMKRTPQQELIGLATYNHVAATDLPLRNTYDLISNRLLEISNNFEAGGMTIGGGIDEGLNVLANPTSSRPWSTKVVILLTDGKHNWGTAPLSAAGRAKKQGVVCYTVSFSNEADINLMQKIAEDTGGKHFRTRDRDELRRAFRSIANELPVLLTK
jgi:Flp pilus assembly protein TadG